MNNIKTYIVGAIAVLALVLAGAALTRPASSGGGVSFGAIPSVNAPAANTVLPNGQLLPNPSNFDYLVARLYFYVDGALGLGNGTSVPTNIQVVRALLTAATTTPCALRSPFTTATSTITSFTLNVTTGTSSASQLIFATSSTPYATTSMLMTATIPASAQASFVSSGVATSSQLGSVVVPGGYAVIGTGAGSAVGYGYTYGGSCSATFQTIN